jgi:hypothetical protein
MSVRALIRHFDAGMRRAQGVFEFCDDETCLFRLQITSTRRDLLLDQVTLPKGSAVLELHLWNEHLLALPPTGPDLAWANRMRCLFMDSLYAVGRHLEIDPRLAKVQAVGGISGLLSTGERSSGERMIRRLGFAVWPYRSRLGGFGIFWENFYSWCLMWAYNPVSLNRRQLLRLRRVEFWMPADEFLQRFRQSQTEAVNLCRLELV